MTTTPQTRGRGRPGIGPGVHIRLDPALLAAVDDWANTRDITRADAIRQLLQAGIDIRTTDKAKGAMQAATDWS